MAFKLRSGNKTPFKQIAGKYGTGVSENNLLAEVPIIDKKNNLLPEFSTGVNENNLGPEVKIVEKKKEKKKDKKKGKKKQALVNASNKRNELTEAQALKAKREKYLNKMKGMADILDTPGL